MVSLGAWALLFATLCKYELTAKHTRFQLRALRRRLAGEHGRQAPRRRSAAPEPTAGTATARGSGRGSLVVSALSAELPALPLHTAGKYVAGAYIVVFAMVLIYVAIMAIRLSHIERELGELLTLTDDEQAAGAPDASGRPPEPHDSSSTARESAPA